MKRWKLPIMTVCAFLVASLSAGGCSKVSDPEKKAGPSTTMQIRPSMKAPEKSATEKSAPEKIVPEGPQPVIASDEQEHDFGSVSQGEEAKHVFTVKNTGKGVLKIDRARGG